MSSNPRRETSPGTTRPRACNACSAPRARASVRANPASTSIPASRIAPIARDPATSGGGKVHGRGTGGLDIVHRDVVGWRTEHTFAEDHQWIVDGEQVQVRLSQLERGEDQAFGQVSVPAGEHIDLPLPGGTGL